MQQFNLQGQPFITLNKLLKVQGWCDSGGQAKQLIDAGLVAVDGTVELRRRCKICSGQRVEFQGNQVEVVA
jgi:ribosome-associated protein